MVIEWRFGDDEQSGEDWLRRPTALHAYVDYRLTTGEPRMPWRRVMVATKGWLDAQLTGFKSGSPRVVWVGLPTMVIVDDGNGEVLRAIVDRIVQQGGLDLYSAVLN